jgi:hypothetical protein
VALLALFGPLLGPLALNVLLCFVFFVFFVFLRADYYALYRVKLIQMRRDSGFLSSKNLKLDLAMMLAIEEPD